MMNTFAVIFFVLTDLALVQPNEGSDDDTWTLGEFGCPQIPVSSINSQGLFMYMNCHNCVHNSIGYWVFL